MPGQAPVRGAIIVLRFFDPRSAILRTGALLLGIPILFQAVSLAYLIRAHGQTSSAEAWLLHSNEVMRRGTDFGRILAEAHGALRANGIFRDFQFELDRRRRVNEAPRHLRELRRLLADNDWQRAQLDRLAEATDRYLAWFAGMERLAAAGDWDRYLEIFWTLQGKRLLEEVERELARLNAEEERLDTARRVEADAARARERRTLAVTAIVGGVLAVALLGVFARGFSARIKRIAANGERMANGEPLLPPLQGHDEVAGLDRAIHDAASRLEAAGRAERRQKAELERRRDELERLNKELEFKTQESEMFVYSVSHDLRSPLVNLQGFTRELVTECKDLRRAAASLEPGSPVRQRLVATLDGDMQEAIGFIQTAVTRLSSIVDALLRLSRAGRVELRPERVELDEMVSRIIRSMRVSIEERAAQVQVQPLPAVKGDRAAIEQVLANLIVNAINYLDPARPGRIEVLETPSDKRGFVTVAVKDNGLGIPDRYLSKLFLPFERLHGATVKGEGIGLALARRMVERHDGRIWLESKENEGTTFYVSLPAADAMASPAPSSNV